MKPEVDAHEIFTWIGGELGGGKEKFEWRTEAMTVKELLKLCLDSRGVLHLLIMREGIRGWVELQLKCGSWKISVLKSFENPGDATTANFKAELCQFVIFELRLIVFVAANTISPFPYPNQCPPWLP